MLERRAEAEGPHPVGEGVGVARASAPGGTTRDRAAKKDGEEDDGQRRGTRGTAPTAAPVGQITAGEGGFLLCARCRRVITSAADRIDIDGLREHSQVNPHGFVWTFHCYARAPGCAPVGPPSTDFTWFPGHSWQIEQCGGCGWHLGWLFRSPDRHFHGLIAGRLVEAEPDDDALS